jgi:3-hydroxyacyl-CoA dehydrogenase/enoyl-CoA hydratase/3-hydroxybutyryl-CoA epimerase
MSIPPYKEFMAGADLKMFTEHTTAEEVLTIVNRLPHLYRSIETSGKPFVAAINALPLDGGYELCLACHYRIALDNPSVKVGLPEVQLGLMPGAGGTQRLPRMIGYEGALPLLLEGKYLKASQAKEKGLVDELESSRQELLDQARN